MPELRATTLEELESHLEAYCGDELEWTFLGRTVRIGIRATDRPGAGGYWEGKIETHGDELRLALPSRSELVDVFDPNRCEDGDPARDEAGRSDRDDDR